MFANSFICLCFACVLLGADASERTWTDVQGRTFKGTFVRLEGDRIVIDTKTGERRLALSRLSEADQQFARDQTESLTAESEARAAEAAELAKLATRPTFESALESAATETEKPQAKVPDANAAPVPLDPAKLPGAKRKFELQRVWTDVAGQKVTAKFVRMHEGSVVLQGTKLYNVPFMNLCADDQTFLREYLESEGRGSEVPVIIKTPKGSLQLPANDNVAKAYRDAEERNAQLAQKEKERLERDAAEVEARRQADLRLGEEKAELQRLKEREEQLAAQRMQEQFMERERLAREQHQQEVIKEQEKLAAMQQRAEAVERERLAIAESQRRQSSSSDWNLSSSDQRALSRLVAKLGFGLIAVVISAIIGFFRYAAR